MSEVKDRSPELASAAEPVPLRPGKPGWNSTFIALNADGTGRGDGENCPVAQACRQAWPGCEPHVHGTEPHVILANGIRKPLLLSPSLIAEIGKYDRGEPAFKNMTLQFIGGVG